MSTAQRTGGQGASAPETVRPRKPRTSWTVPVGILGFLALSWWAGSDRFGIGFSVLDFLENLQRGGRIASELLSPTWSFVSVTVEPFLETIKMAIIATTIGCAIALVAAFLASKVSAPGLVSYLSAKGVLNVIRSMPDLLYALVFVSAFSIGPVAGILALIFFNVGVVAKLLSETVDAVDTGPVEAAAATGATKLRQVRTAIFPQVLPNYLAFSLYVFELNLRASTVLGFVGAGGIGQTLDIALSRFRYDLVSVVIIEIFVIVFIVEAISIALRRRLV